MLGEIVCIWDFRIPTSGEVFFTCSLSLSLYRYLSSRCRSLTVMMFGGGVGGEDPEVRLIGRLRFVVVVAREKLVVW